MNKNNINLGTVLAFDPAREFWNRWRYKDRFWGGAAPLAKLLRRQNHLPDYICPETFYWLRRRLDSSWRMKK